MTALMLLVLVLLFFAFADMSIKALERIAKSLEELVNLQRNR